MTRHLVALAVFCVTSASTDAQTLAVRPTQVAAARRDSTDSAVRFGRLTAALNTSELNTRRLLGITGLRAASIAFVDVRDWLTADMVQAFDAAVLRNARAITTMRSELQNSLVLRDALLERGLTMSHVVAVEVFPDATNVTVFYRRGMENRWP